MSLPDTRILTKKTSKHPKDLNRDESYEEIHVDNDQKAKSKVDIFSMQNIFLNEIKPSQNPTKITQRVTKTHHQKQKNSIASREVVKRMINQKRKKQQKAKLAQMNLSLIQQTQSEHNVSSSSRSNSVLDQSSIDHVSSQEMSSDLESNDDRFNEGFIVLQQEGQQNDALNRTVVMKKKKAPKEFQTPTRTPQKLTQKQKAQLQILAQQYPLDALQAFYLRGKIKQIEYLYVLQIKKQEERQFKLDKFYQNLQKIQKIAQTIDQNYNLIEKKLNKDIEKDRLKIKTFTQNIIEMNKKKERKSKLPNPLQSELQLKILEVIAELNAKQNFFSILKKARQEFQLEYNKSLQKIQGIKKTQQNISENLIFIEIKQLLKKNQQNYHYLASSLVKNCRNEKSLIACHARQHYLKLLEQKYSRQLTKIQEFKNEHTTNEASKLLRSPNVSQISQQILMNFFQSAQQKVFKKLYYCKQNLLNYISWLRMVRKDGKLQEGQIFRESTWILANNMPLNVSISEQKQKYLIQNFKFYRRKVFKILQLKFQTIKEINDTFLTKQVFQWQKVQKNKRQNVLTRTNFLEKRVNILESSIEKDNLNSILFSKRSLRRSNENQNIYGYFDILKKKIQNMVDLEDKAKILLEFQAPNFFSKKKSLIPQKMVTKMNLRTQNSEIQDFQQMSLKQKLNSRYKITLQPQYIKTQLERDGQSFETLSNSMKKIDLKREILEEASNFSELEDEKFTDQEKKKHLNQVYELIIKNQISKSQPQEKCQSHEPYYVPTEWEIRQSLMSRTKYTHECHIQASPQLQYQEFLTQKKMSNKPNFSNNSHQSFQSLNQNFSIAQIEQSCKQFIREFYLNPNLSSQLNFSQEQFYFLASPQYRKYFLDKKVNDQQLQQRILTLIKNNPYPMNQSKYQYVEQNPVNHMIQTDPYFQLKIQQYQQKIVKNQQLFDPYQPKLVYHNQSSDYSRMESISSLFDPFESRINEIQAKRSLSYWSQKKSDFDTVASEHQQFQEWLSNRC